MPTNRGYSMPVSSLLPEPPLWFSPGLAETIGLEEAILLQQLASLLGHRQPASRDGRAWLGVEGAWFEANLPFWGPQDIQRIARSLAEKGLIHLQLPPPRPGDLLYLALDEAHGGPGPTAEPIQPAAGSPRAPTAPTPGAGSPVRAGELPRARRGARTLPADWSPSEDLLRMLEWQHGIPRDFILEQREEFVFYWRERGEPGHAWENKFRQHVLSLWRRHQQQKAEAAPLDRPLDNHWRPSPDALEILLRAGVDREFIEEAVPEFILYWRERGGPPKGGLNSRFVQHIRIQWARYSSSMVHSTEPRRISPDWEPNGDVFDILRLSHIDESFARSLLPEFIVYWRDSNQVHTSWNSKFLQHVKFHWARKHQLQQAGSQHAGQQRVDGAGRTRDRSLAEDLSDTSWAK